MKYGTRLIYDKKTGRVLNGTFGEMTGDLQEGLRPKEIDFIDLPFGYNDNNFKEAIEYHIDVKKDKNKNQLQDLIVITKYIEKTETEEEKLRKEKEEVENLLLLKADNDLGGIL